MATDSWKIKHNLNDFNKALQEYADKFNKNLGMLVRRSSLGILTHVQTEWPVLTGRSRASWLPFIWSLSEEAELRAHPSVPPVKAAMAQREGIRAGKYKYKFEGSTPFAWIQSRVHYTPYIEYGTRKKGSREFTSVSEQGGGKGYVKRAIENEARGIKKQLKKIADGESPN